MKLLLDTHTFLWWEADDPKLGRRARTQIVSPANSVLVSAATAWEIAVKRAAGKLVAPGDVGDWIARSGFDELPIEVSHAVASAGLPRHHDDPFDRLLVAQAQAERLTLVTLDEAIARYEVSLLDAGR